MKPFAECTNAEILNGIARAAKLISEQRFDELRAMLPDNNATQMKDSAMRFIELTSVDTGRLFSLNTNHVILYAPSDSNMNYTKLALIDYDDAIEVKEPYARVTEIMNNKI